LTAKPHKPAMSPRSGTLGTFAGVFTPSALTILGIILFLRLDYVVGSAGLGRALLIIGLVLFLAQSVSIAFYCIGFGEVMVDMLPGEELLLMPQMVAAAVCFLFIFAWLGADWATRFQYVVMALLAAALLSFFVGGIPLWESAKFVQNWVAPADSPDFWLLFAIFFRP